MTVRTCRSCNTPKWASDPCSNPDCATTARQKPLRSRTKPVTAAVKHGFHANETTVTSLVCDYDRPISAISKWKSAR